MSEAQARERLLADGFLRQESHRYVPAARWHAAVARAAAALLSQGEELVDLRVPVAWALNESYGASSCDEELVEMVAVMTPLTAIAAPAKKGPDASL